MYTVKTLKCVILQNVSETWPCLAKQGLYLLSLPESKISPIWSNKFPFKLDKTILSFFLNCYGTAADI